MPFDSPDVNLGELLGDVEIGKVQLPDFQREWKWDTDRISALLASISQGYPVGVLMMLETGGPEVNFSPRPIAGANGAAQEPERLLLDGQQRVTSLFQSLKAQKPVDTTDTRGKKLRRLYYVDMAHALDASADREEAIVAVPEDRVLRSNFGRDVEADFSSIEKECSSEMFPLQRVFDMGAVFEWQNRYVQTVEPEGEDANARWNRFYQDVLSNLVGYTVPVIVLTRETPKEAVCTVFEKVNTGGVVLNVFELLTATFASDDFRLNDDWRDRKQELAGRHVLSKLESTDFLQAVSLVVTYRRQQSEPVQGQSQAVSCRRKDILRLTLEQYNSAADDVTNGFKWAAEFLAREKIFKSEDVPYRTQLIPLAALRAIIGPAVDGYAANEKIKRWYWCGVLGELYGGAIETRFARDIEQLPQWIDGGTEPRTIYDASFEASRLETLRTRNSAAYKGIHALLMKRGARDWIKANEIDVAAFFDLKIDIHHIFPRKWCDDIGIDAGRRDSVVNKTPLSWDTNRSIGGRAPSRYLQTVADRNGLDIAELAKLLDPHLIDIGLLRVDDFESFYEARKDALIRLIGETTGKEVRRDDLAPEQSPEYEEESPDQDSEERLSEELGAEDEGPDGGTELGA